MEFKPFPKMPRLYRDVVITEKIDGTNASIYIGENGEFLIGSRTRWITPENDNYGFAKWALENKEELMKLGRGQHFGEWWGAGIQRQYGLTEKRFSLFNTARWVLDKPTCCHTVPILYKGLFSTEVISAVKLGLKANGSFAAPGFMKPEGVII